MKTLTKISLYFLLIFSLTSSLSAIVLDSDTFDGGSADGWSRDDGQNGYLQINQDRSSNKTFHFSSYPNAEVSITFSVVLYQDWENSDRFRIDANGVQTNYYGTNSNSLTLTKTVTTTLNSSGDLDLEFSTNTNDGGEKAYIDYVTIEYTPTTPVITPATFSIYTLAPNDTIVGTISSTGSPNAFTILSGDTDNIFTVSNSGDITVASSTNLENNTTSTYTLEINASNTIGYDVGNFIINLTDDIDLSSDDVNTRPFTNVPLLGKDSITINGSILQIGNQLLCKNSSDGATCEAPSTTSYTQNNNHNQHKARIDTSLGAPTSNTMAKLVFEPGDEVIFARLYWSARVTDITSTQKTNAKTLKIKGPTASTYTSVTSPNAKYNWHKSGSTFDYVASQDVTDYVKAQGAGEYYAGDIVATNGKDKYASWQLVVVVENANRSLKNIAIYDGFYSVYNGGDYPRSASVPASGFITPTGDSPFNANLFIYMGESDDGYDDSVKLLKKDGIETNDGDWTKLVDGANTPDDVVNASVSSPSYTGGYRSNDSGMANPNFRNVLGVDIDELVINDKLDSSQQILSNSQTSTAIKITSNGDRFSLNMFAFETEVFIPEFCYDYAYTQQDRYFTEDNDGSQAPKITGNVIVNDPIEVTIFIKSLVDSSILIENMSIDVSDINRSQAPYIDGSTKLARVGELFAQPVAVTAGTDSDNNDYIHNIDIGTLNQNDYFYVYYSVDPQVNTMDMPITVEANYDLTLDSTSVAYKLKLSQEIPMCTSSNFNYLPAKGIFNVAHNNYYTWNGSSGNKYYNLPTQVTKREGNFKVLAMKSDDFDAPLTTHPTTIAAIEMIDAGAFHYTDASCREVESSISEKVWVIFDENVATTSFNQAALQSAISNGMTKLTSSSDFYTKARPNTAFRVTYNASDINGSITSLTKNGATDLYTIDNFTLSGGSCIQDMNNNGDTTDDMVDSYCSSNMTKGQLSNCMECIYGINTRFICSRDNFAIRPEAFMMKIDDQNQTNPSSKLRIADSVSGVIGTPSTVQTQLAAGYQYNIEVNATNYLSNASSFGYTQSFGPGSNLAEFQWSPSGSPSGCNDDANSTLSFTTVNGEVDFNSSLDQVGEYRLHMEDTTWTTVDHNPLYMSHHDSSATYFISSATPDCTADDSTTQPINSNTKNGCNISSNHDSSGSSLKYRDYNIEFHPYKFEMAGVVPSHGIDNNVSFNDKTFIYMTDMSQDQNMSFHLNGNINAVGFNDVQTTNFVDNCYAKPITLTVNKSLALSADADYRYNFQNTNPAIVDKNGSMDGLTAGLINLATNDFNKTNSGTVNTILNLNFDRTTSNVLNPEELTFTTYNADCTTPANCRMSADLSSVYETKGHRDLNRTDAVNTRITLKHYYGRAHASRQRYTGATGTANMYYEVYCLTTGTNVCDKTLLQQGLNSKRSDDARWFINESHTSNEGNAGKVVEKDSLTRVTSAGTTTGNHPDNSTLMTYDVSQGYPYKTTMEHDASGWLIYNKDNPTAAKNQFAVEFDTTGSGWSGAHETDTTTKDPGTVTTNRRSMW